VTSLSGSSFPSLLDPTEFYLAASDSEWEKAKRRESAQHMPTKQLYHRRELDVLANDEMSW
jgi:hypothetical protein